MRDNYRYKYRYELYIRTDSSIDDFIRDVENLNRNYEVLFSAGGCASKDVSFRRVRNRKGDDRDSCFTSVEIRIKDNIRYIVFKECYYTDREDEILNEYIMTDGIICKYDGLLVITECVDKGDDILRYIVKYPSESKECKLITYFINKVSKPETAFLLAHTILNNEKDIASILGGLDVGK